VLKSTGGAQQSRESLAAALAFCQGPDKRGLNSYADVILK
jgi:hypothetical protein